MKINPLFSAVNKYLQIIMGNKSSINLIQRYNTSSGDWIKLLSYDDRAIWRNLYSGQQMEQFQVIVGNQEQLYWEKKAFILRHNNQMLVATKYFKQQKTNQICSTISKGSLFLQNIVLRLSQIDQVPYPDILHLYNQTLKGFQQLSFIHGPFIPEKDFVCINKEAQVKVWCHSNLAKRSPNSFSGARTTQDMMVLSIIKMIDGNANKNGAPFDIASLLIEGNQRMTFKNTINKFQRIISDNQLVVPSKLQSVVDLFDKTGSADPFEVIKRIEQINTKPEGDQNYLNNPEPVHQQSIIKKQQSKVTSSFSSHQKSNKNVVYIEKATKSYNIFKPLPQQKVNLPTTSTNRIYDINLNNVCISSPPEQISRRKKSLQNISYNQKMNSMGQEIHQTANIQLLRRSHSVSKNTNKSQVQTIQYNLSAAHPNFNKKNDKISGVQLIGDQRMIKTGISETVNKQLSSNNFCAFPPKHNQSILPTAASFQMNSSLNNNVSRVQRFISSPSADNLSTSYQETPSYKQYSSNISSFKKKLKELNQGAHQRIAGLTNFKLQQKNRGVNILPSFSFQAQKYIQVVDSCQAHSQSFSKQNQQKPSNLDSKNFFINNLQTDHILSKTKEREKAQNQGLFNRDVFIQQSPLDLVASIKSISFKNDCKQMNSFSLEEFQNIFDQKKQSKEYQLSTQQLQILEKELNEQMQQSQQNSDGLGKNQSMNLFEQKPQNLFEQAEFKAKVQFQRPRSTKGSYSKNQKSAEKSTPPTNYWIQIPEVAMSLQQNSCFTSMDNDLARDILQLKERDSSFNNNPQDANSFGVN